MFKKADLEAYRSIKAPEKLKDDVLSAVKEGRGSKRPIYKTVGALAACLVLVMTLGVFLNQPLPPAEIYVEQITSNPSFRHVSGSWFITVTCEEGIAFSSEDDCFYYYPDGSETPAALKKLKTDDDVLKVGFYLDTPSARFKVNGETYEISINLFSVEPFALKKIK